MNKQEAIKQAYGEHWETVKDYVDENGKVSMIIDNAFVTPNFSDLGFTREFVESSVISWYDSDKNTHFWQFKSLQGIEDNNGWVKIEKNFDFSKVNLDKTVFVVVENQGVSMASFRDIKNQLIYNVNFTHYQAIDNPKPPIY